MKLPKTYLQTEILDSTEAGDRTSGATADFQLSPVPSA